jgi:hypothetical protein
MAISTTQSFLLEVRDSTDTLLDRFAVPMEGAGVFINLLFDALPAPTPATLREPWYRLVPRRLQPSPLTPPPVTPPLPPLPVGVAVPDLVPDPADPVRSITVTLYDLDQTIYTADYGTVEVFGPLLRFLLARRINEERYATATPPLRLRVVPQGVREDMSIFSLLPPETPVDGVFPLPVPRGTGRRTTFQLVTTHTYEPRSLADMGPRRSFTPHLGGQHHIIWQPAAYRQLRETQYISPTVEVGGYLVGQVYQQADDPERLLVEVQQVLAAEGTRSSALLLLFTGDSWSGLRRYLARTPEQRLLGWWHTHLFPASDSFGLSGLDETLHRQFFPNPWHFAALLNVSAEQGKVLRCYQNDTQGNLVECSFSVGDEGDGRGERGEGTGDRGQGRGEREQGTGDE